MYDFPFNILKTYFYDIEEVNLVNSFTKLSISIEEEQFLSKITKIRIEGGSLEKISIPIKSFKSLKVLVIKVNKIYFEKPFPLFNKECLHTFTNLEHLEIQTNNMDIIDNLILNFDKIMNLRYLSIIHENIFEYQNQIIKNCVLLLKKLHTLILGISADKI
jgi:hypothetical protein